MKCGVRRIEGETYARICGALYALRYRTEGVDSIRTHVHNLCIRWGKVSTRAPRVFGGGNSLLKISSASRRRAAETPPKRAALGGRGGGIGKMAIVSYSGGNETNVSAEKAQASTSARIFETNANAGRTLPLAPPPPKGARTPLRLSALCHVRAH